MKVTFYDHHGKGVDSPVEITKAEVMQRIRAIWFFSNKLYTVKELYAKFEQAGFDVTNPLRGKTIEELRAK